MQNFIRNLNTKFTLYLGSIAIILLAAIQFHHYLFEYALVVCFFVSLAFGWIFIFRPSVKALRDGNQRLEGLNNQLKASHQKLLEEQQKTSENLQQIQRLHEDLKEKEYLYRRLINSSDNMIYELDEFGKFVFVNPITEKITGFSKKQLSNKLLWEIVHPNHKDTVLQFYSVQRKKNRNTVITNSRSLQPGAKQSGSARA